MKLKLKILAKEASAGPPIGPAFGQAGLKAIDFVKQFNLKSEIFNPGVLLPVKIKIFANKMYTFQINYPPLTVLIGLVLKERSERYITARELMEIIYLRNKDGRSVLNEFNKARGTCSAMKVRIVYDEKDN